MYKNLVVVTVTYSLSMTLGILDMAQFDGYIHTYIVVTELCLTLGSCLVLLRVRERVYMSCSSWRSGLRAE